MAQARMLNRSVAVDERLNGLSHDAMLLYLMTVPHLDRDGLIDGRPRILWAQVAPLQDAWIQSAGALIEEWVECGLVVRFGDGRPVLFFPGFQKNQPRMLYKREQASQHPCPPGYRRAEDGLEAVSGSGGNRDVVASESRVSRAEVVSESGAGREDVRPRRAEVKDQDQDQTEVEVGVVGDLNSLSPRVGGVGKNACVREENFAEAEVGEDGRFHLTQAGVMRQALREGRALSAGDLMFAYTDEQVLRVAFAMGSLLGLHMEWGGFERWLRKQDTPSLWEFVWWCQFYGDLPAEKLQGIKSLPGLIQTNLRDGVSAPLSGNQRKAVAKMIERVEELGADVFSQVVVPAQEDGPPF